MGLFFYSPWSKAWDEEPIYPEAFSQAKRALCNELFDGVGHQLFVSLADSTGDADALPEDCKDTIDSVLDYYYAYAAKRLGYRIRFDHPWRDTRERMEQDRHFSGVITIESMKKHYQMLL